MVLILDLILVTIDVTAHYTNISPVHGLAAITAMWFKREYRRVDVLLNPGVEIRSLQQIKRTIVSPPFFFNPESYFTGNSQ